MTEFSELSDSCYAHLKYYINYQKKKKKKTLIQDNLVFQFLVKYLTRDLQPH